MKLKRVFVANRGEIALRVIRACHALGLEAVLGVSEADRDSLPAREADRTVCIGPAQSSKSYLRPELLVTAAAGTGCDSVHPGYGFLSERAPFVRACKEMGLVFIGPAADAIEAMGDKISAITLAKKAGVPVVPGSAELGTLAEVTDAIRRIGFPFLIKASAGGGGRGMRVVRGDDEVAQAFDSARAEAAAAFGDSRIYIEKFIDHARHVEVQVLGDQHGNVIHLYDRDCTVQRRHQKLIEEAPSPVLSPKGREGMTSAAVALARSVGYFSAGTVEFVYDQTTGQYYFLEMNTRVQVEHPVTEMITGVDIVQQQIRIASGEPLSIAQNDVRVQGHAIEIRINAEDPARDFLPAPGKISKWEPSRSAGVRVDSHCMNDYIVPPFYDSMLGKLIVHGQDRSEAIARMLAAIDEFVVDGVSTTLPLHRDVIGSRAFASSSVSTRWLETTFLPDWQRSLQSAATP